MRIYLQEWEERMNMEMEGMDKLSLRNKLEIYKLLWRTPGEKITPTSILEALKSGSFLIILERPNLLRSFLLKPFPYQVRLINKLRMDQNGLYYKIFYEVVNIQKSLANAVIERKNLEISKIGSWNFPNSFRISLRNERLIESVVQKIDDCNNIFTKMDIMLMILIEYLFIVEGPFDDLIDLLLCLILIKTKELKHPYNKKVIKTSNIIYNELNLSDKKALLNSYKANNLASIINNRLRNSISHLWFKIDDRIVNVFDNHGNIERINIIHEHAKILVAMNAVIDALLANPKAVSYFMFPTKNQ